MHQIFIFIGSVALAVLFGAHWSNTGAIATGILGAVIGIALASGIDEHVSLPGAILRWVAMIGGGAALGCGLGWVVDWFGHGDKAMIPASIVGGIVGLMLCPGVRAA